MTMTDKPDLLFYNTTTITSPRPQTIKFLGENDVKSSKNPNLTTFQTIGVKAAVYPFAMPKVDYPFPGPVDMKFDPIYLKNKVLLLLSDYTLNTLFYMGQQSQNLWINVGNDTQGLNLPFTIDTKGLGIIVPELTNFFPNQNYNCTLKIGILGIHKQPIITTQDDGSEVYLNFGMDFVVHNETTPFDDAFKAVTLNIEFSIRMKIYTADDRLNVKIGEISAKNVTADSHIGKIDTEKLKKTLESLVRVAVSQQTAMLKNIDIVTKLKNYTGLTFYDILFDSNPGHHAITLNYKDD